MRHHYRILNTALMLREFTVSHLAEVAGVNLSTARTVLARERENFDRAGPEATGRPGGQLRLYRIKPAAVEPIKKRLRGLVDEIGPEPDVLLSAGDVAGVPATLLVAHNLVSRQIGRATSDDQRRAVLDSVRTACLSAERDWKNSGQHDERDETAFDVHSRAVKLLFTLALGKVEGVTLPFRDLARLHGTLIRTAQELVGLQHSEHALTLLAKAKELQDGLRSRVGRGTALIDAISKHRGTLTKRVRTLLSERLGLQDIKYVRVSETGTLDWTVIESAQSVPWPAFVTVDSKRDGTNWIKEIVAHQQDGCYVFDANYSPEACEVVAKSKGFYYPDAPQLSDHALTAVLQLPFEQLRDAQSLPLLASRVEDLQGFVMSPMIHRHTSWTNARAAAGRKPDSRPKAREGGKQSKAFSY